MFLHNVKVDIVLKGKVKNYQQSLREVVSYQTFYVFSISISHCLTMLVGWAFVTCVNIKRNLLNIATRKRHKSAITRRIPE